MIGRRGGSEDIGGKKVLVQECVGSSKVVSGVGVERGRGQWFVAFFVFFLKRVQFWYSGNKSFLLI